MTHIVHPNPQKRGADVRMTTSRMRLVLDKAPIQQVALFDPTHLSSYALVFMTLSLT
jgi:hypothetical protein